MKLQKKIKRLATLLLSLALSAGYVSGQEGQGTINIDFNGGRNNPGPYSPGPTFSGVGAAGGGLVWNGVLADSRLIDETDDDNLTIGGTNLLNSLGGATTVTFSIGPVGGDNPLGGAGSDTNNAAALFGDNIFVGYLGQASGTADFTISGLGTGSLVRLYFYYGNAGNFVIPGASSTVFPGGGVFTPANTVYFGTVPVTNGTVVGTMGTGPKTVLYGMTIQQLLPRPFIKSASPTGVDVADSATITIELEDYVTQVVTNSIQLLVNGSAVTATVSKPLASSTTTVTYTPAGKWADASTNTYSIIFGDDADPSLVQTNDFIFVVFNTALAAATVNIDFNGVGGSQAIGATYVGAGPAGGGSVFNGIVADSRPGINLVHAGADNLMNSLGHATTVGFTIGEVIGDNNFAFPPSSHTWSLTGDYVVSVPSFPNYPGPAEFTISGLGGVTNVDVYLISHLSGPGMIVPGASPAPYVPSPGGASTFAQKLVAEGGQLGWIYYWPNVPVTNGVINGKMDGGSSSILMSSMTIQAHVPLELLPLTLSLTPTDNGFDLSWQGMATLQAAPQLTGPWVDIATTSPWNIPLSGDDGLYVLEAEHFDSQSTGTGVALGYDWVFSTSPTNAGGDGSIGWSGDGTMQALPNGPEDLNLGANTTDGPRLNYNINVVDPGTYYVWVRGFGDSAPGPSTDDSLFVGIDEEQFGGPISGFAQGAGYVWSSGGGKNFVGGSHVVTVAMRETGQIIDKIILTKDPSYIPTGMGPTEGPPESRPIVPEPMQFYRLKQ